MPISGGCTGVGSPTRFPRLENRVSVAILGARIWPRRLATPEVLYQTYSVPAIMKAPQRPARHSEYP